MRKPFQESIKALEADVQHANALASEFLKDYDGALLQMRIAYSPAAHFVLQWTDCKLAGALGLLKIMIYKVYVKGTTIMPAYEREASIREFYAVIFPSLLQLQSGITDVEYKKQKKLCMERYRRRDHGARNQFSKVDAEREEECGICLEMNGKVVLPNCIHTMCMTCYEDWHARSKSCPFCRACLRSIKSGDLWIYTDKSDVVDMDTVTRENTGRLFMYINKLPLVILDVVLAIYDYNVK